MRASWLSAAVLSALGACRTVATEPDVGPLYDTARPPFEAPDAPRPMPVGLVQVRLANLVPAMPNLTVCLSTVAGTGAPETRGTILGEPSAVSDGTLPSPGISPYLPLPALATPGHHYVIRLYDSEDVPFTLGGPCPVVGAVGSPEPAIRTDVSPSMLGGSGTFTAVVMGVLPETAGTIVTCPGGSCPEVRLAVFPDDNSTLPTSARARVIHAIPNLPAPIEICVDPDLEIDHETMMVVRDGFIPEIRIMPPASDSNGLSFGEASPYAMSMPLQEEGAVFVHAVVTGVPSCNAATLLLGPTPIPFPIPPAYPPEVARTIDAGDVITNFAFGRVGGACTTDADCIMALTGHCDTDRNVCEDLLSPNVLPWQDVMGPTPP